MYEFKLIPFSAASCWSFSLSPAGRRIVVCSRSVCLPIYPTPPVCSATLHFSCGLVTVLGCINGGTAAPAKLTVLQMLTYTLQSERI